MNKKFFKTIILLIVTATLVLLIRNRSNLQNLTKPDKHTEIIEYKQEFIPTKTKTGNCWTSSNVASSNVNAFRCSVGSVLYDPCFKSGGNKTICDTTPFDNQNAFELKLTKPLPNIQTETDRDGQLANWIIELENHIKCTKFSGTAGSIPSDASNKLDEMYFYTCDDKSVIVGYPDMSDSLWRAQVAYIAGDKVDYKDYSIIKAWR